ncbi:MAG: PHP domain-containing protein [Thaumarchaeota archaeon]|nr:PHP domain-containing protein [Nitrososphaerota archaeon]
MQLRAELHCHNVFSNFRLGDEDPPYDCDVTFRDQLEQANKLELEALFVTNHNTLNGYSQILKYKNDHSKFKNIQIYPAEEITTDTGAHILAYGLQKEIRPGLSMEEIIDEIKKQNGISSAPHPFSLIDALREKAKNCDMIEVFNSNNVDVVSNLKANQFALENKMIQVSGSDSHVNSTLGRCVNEIDSENTLDDVLSAMKHNKIKILNTGYALPDETLEHLKFKIENSKDYIFEYVKKHHPNSVWLFSFLLKMYNRDPDSYLWNLFYKIALYFLKRVSYKINFKNLDSDFMNQRNPLTIFKNAL